MTTTGRKPYFATNYQDMMRHVYMKPKGHSEGRKPYMENDYFDTEYPQLKKYNGRGIPPGTEPPIGPPIEPTECQKWFWKTIIVSGYDYFLNNAFINKIYSERGLCEKIHTIILSCLQYNSLSFCMCCHSAMWETGNPGLIYAGCDQDFGPVADGEWKCCSPPCPSFSIEVLSEDTNTVCYKATADCDIRVSWEKKTGGNPWEPMDGSGCTDMAICGGQVKATDLCGNEETKALPGLTTPAGIISCSVPPCDEVVKSTTKQYTYIDCGCGYGGVIWTVSGTGASISQGGLLTTNATACGTLTITATQSGCQPATRQVRVTDGGTWVNIFSSNPDTSGCTSCGGGIQCQWLGYIVGNRRYYLTRSRLSNIGGCRTQAQWDILYNNYLAAGGLGCNATAGGCILSSYGMGIQEWSCP